MLSGQLVVVAVVGTSLTDLGKAVPENSETGRAPRALLGLVLHTLQTGL